MKIYTLSTIFIFGTLLLLLLLSSCKKQYSCECNTLGNKAVVFVEKTTKKDADKKCKYYQNSETDCYVK